MHCLDYRPSIGKQTPDKVYRYIISDAAAGGNIGELMKIIELSIHISGILTNFSA